MKDQLPIEIVRLGAELQKLSNLHAGGKAVLLAGGAPRDIEHGKPVKDYDFFVPNSVYWSYINNIAYGLFGTHIKRTIADASGKYPFEVRNIGDNIQIISVEDTIEEVRNFDIGLCMIAIDFKDGCVRREPEYIKDKKNKTLTNYVGRDIPGTYAPTHRITYDVREFTRHKEHLDRLLLKYEGYKYRHKLKYVEVPF